jgi:hypothetical protein
MFFEAASKTHQHPAAQSAFLSEHCEQNEKPNQEKLHRRANQAWNEN